MSRDNSPTRARRPDAQPFDEVHVVTVPRYKTSDASGDEWRTKVRMEFKLKGKVCHCTWYDSIEHALAAAPYHFLFSEQGSCITLDGSCDQESCAAPATVTYKVKKYYDQLGHATDPYEFSKRPVVRRFCALHAVRGDCGLEDADDNYEKIV